MTAQINKIKEDLELAHSGARMLGNEEDVLRISRLWKKHPEVFGNVDSDRFPLLIKIIDAKDDLSIQVHPDDDYAKVHENGSLGKTECWYILDCKENATIVIGHGFHCILHHDIPGGMDIC